MKTTKQFDIFKKVSGNRPVDKRHVKNLCFEISKQNLLYLNPIIVNKQMEIIDGQHRLEAAKTLDVEIFYTVGDSLAKESIITLSDCSLTFRRGSSH